MARQRIRVIIGPVADRDAQRADRTNRTRHGERGSDRLAVELQFEDADAVVQQPRLVPPLRLDDAGLTACANPYAVAVEDRTREPPPGTTYSAKLRCPSTRL
jgi:hypothetical protein